MPTVIPAYGRDYKSAKAAIADWLDGRDFIIADCSSPYNGTYCSIRDYPQQTVYIRYSAHRKITVYKP